MLLGPILILAATAAGETRVFQVNGAESFFNGPYAEDEAGTIFTRFGQPESAGKLWYDEAKGSWIIGFGKAFEKEIIVYYVYSGEGDEHSPPTNNEWRYNLGKGYSNLL